MPEGPEVETEKLHEAIHEELEKEGGEFLKRIALTTALLAAIAAVASLQAGATVNEALVLKTEATRLQAEASDQWAYYQAKNIRRHSYEMGVDMLSITEFKDKGAAEKVRAKYQQEADRYTKEQAEIEEQAKDLEKESALEQRKANRFDLGEVFLEVALVITSLALLTKKKTFWMLGMVSGLAGLAVASTGFLLH